MQCNKKSIVLIAFAIDPSTQAIIIFSIVCRLVFQNTEHKMAQKCISVVYL